MASKLAPAPVLAPVVDVHGLKHLAFVAGAADTATSAATGLYKTARPYVPSFVEPIVGKIEETAVAFTAPVVTKAADVGDMLLHKADEQVEYVAKTTSSVVKKSKEGITSVYDAGLASYSSSTSTLKELGNSSIKTVKAGAQRYMDNLRDLSSWLADKLSPSKNLAWTKAQLHAAIAAVNTATDPDYAIGKVHDAWASFAAVPAVAKLLSTLQPITNFGTSSFVKAHDTLLSLWVYKSTYKLGAGTLNFATSTTPYKLSSKYLYPWVAPIADPALGKLTGSKNLVAAVGYWTPAV